MLQLDVLTSLASFSVTPVASKRYKSGMRQPESPEQEADSSAASWNNQQAEA
jgi:hypothetical protein